jgi:pyruvate,orthophosphate dikinase
MKRIYAFGGGKAEGGKELKDLLGGKGAGVAEMSRIGLPVPPGFTITTEVCNAYAAAGKRLPDDLVPQIRTALAQVERLTGRRFGDAENPLLVSVRSGARVSMPGMMDTVLNLGLNERTVGGLAAQAGDERFAWDSHRRFIAMFGDVVLGLKPRGKEDRDPFEAILEAKKRARGVRHDPELDVAALREIVLEFKAEVRRRTGADFPDDPFDQLLAAIGAVFRSWDNDRAVAYRDLNGIPASWGTAVTVQAMVFGNMGDDSGTGVAFTRSPATGEDVLYGEFLVNAQGEDVVAGIRTPQAIAELGARWPDLARQLAEVRSTLERHYRDMQDIEFTVERGKLYVLQTRSGKRTGLAAVRIAVDLVEKGIVSRDEALLRVEPEALDHLLRPVFDDDAMQRAVAEGRLLAKGLPAGPGAASGRVVFLASDAEAWRERGERVILARHETSPEDIRGMAASEGIVTAFGGMTSHAALVARQMGKVAVVGCEALSFDLEARTMTVATAQGPRVLREGDWLSLDGTAGEVVEGELATSPSEVVQVLVERTLAPDRAPVHRVFAKLLGWADRVRRLGVRANADQADQAAAAVAFGAEGIGLCRTEHMFFGEGKIGPMREMIVAEDEEERRAALAKLLPLQRDDFRALFRAMAPRPVTIRTLDPPLHEFLPHDDEGIAALAQATGKGVDRVRARIEELAEANPMLGHRGCRLGVSYPEITAMQARAIVEAACDVAAEGLEVRPEIMIPLVGDARELVDQERVVREVAETVVAERGVPVRVAIGTMIEVPRAALTAGSIAAHAEFFSFGTNDLTQMTYGVSRDDLGPVLRAYRARGIWEVDPFVTIDRDGVGSLLRIAAEQGRRARPGLKLGICGEHGGDPASIAFCDGLGLDYVSCSPYRIPIARLAAAQAALRARAASATRTNGARAATERRKPSKSIPASLRARVKAAVARKVRQPADGDPRRPS